MLDVILRYPRVGIFIYLLQGQPETLRVRIDRLAYSPTHPLTSPAILFVETFLSSFPVPSSFSSHYTIVAQHSTAQHSYNHLKIPYRENPPFAKLSCSCKICTYEPSTSISDCSTILYPPSQQVNLQLQRLNARHMLCKIYHVVRVARCEVRYAVDGEARDRMECVTNTIT